MGILSAGVIVVGIATIVASGSATTMTNRSLSVIENRTTTTDAPLVYSYCGVDIVGGDQWVARHPNPSACLTNCLPQTGCNAATWTNTDGGTCYFKRLTGGFLERIKVVPKAGAISFMREDDDTPLADSGYMSDTDIPGNDFASEPAVSASACPTICFNNQKCSAVTWSSYNGGTCWLKTKPSSFVRSPGAVSYIVPHDRNPDVCFAYL